ncbi:MAG: endonuclease/exonuclease/phosphatase family protein [Actinomycetota bacterium]|nr:endonuclease/exonuclease/phosphatase family protein [Actinomycetota bacterium]
MRAATSVQGPSILGIYSCPETGSGRAYEDQVIACLTAWADKLTSGDTIVAGDFNIGHALGRTVPNAWVTRAHALWTELGLVSAYHFWFKEDLTVPTRATHFWTYKQEHGWHIDYVLIHRSRLEQLQAVTVGSYEEWIRAGAAARSDHVPIIVDIDWR